MQEKWKLAKQELEDSFEYIHKKPVSFTDHTLFTGLLFCFERGCSESFPEEFAFEFSEEEIEAIPKRKPSTN